MKAFFRDSARLSERGLRATYFAFVDRRPLGEVALVEELWEELLLQGKNWEDLLSLLKKGYVAWFSNNLCVAEGHSVEVVDASGEKVSSLLTVYIPSGRIGIDVVKIFPFSDAEPDTEAKRIFQLLAQVPVDDVSMIGSPDNRQVPVSEETFASIVEMSNVHGGLDWSYFRFTNAHCQALASFPGKLEFLSCTLQDRGRSILESVAHNRGPKGLKFGESVYDIDPSALLHAVSASERLTSLTIHCRYIDIKLPQLVRALQQNRGLTELTLWQDRVYHLESDWVNLLASIRTNATLQDITFGILIGEAEQSSEKYVAVRRRISLAVADLVKANKVLQRVYIGEIELDPTIEQQQIDPCLKSNVLRARVKALTDEPPSVLRNRLFGAALLRQDVLSDRSILWLLLSGFHELVPQLYEEARSKEAALRRSDFGSPANKRPRLSNTDV